MAPTITSTITASPTTSAEWRGPAWLVSGRRGRPLERTEITCDEKNTHSTPPTRLCVYVYVYMLCIFLLAHAQAERLGCGWPTIIRDAETRPINAPPCISDGKAMEACTPHIIRIIPHITSHRIASHHITSHHITSHHTPHIIPHITLHIIPQHTHTGSLGVVVVSHRCIAGTLLFIYCDIASSIIRMPASPCTSAADIRCSGGRDESAAAVGRGRSNDSACRPFGALVVPRSSDTMTWARARACVCVCV